MVRESLVRRYVKGVVDAVGSFLSRFSPERLTFDRPLYHPTVLHIELCRLSWTRDKVSERCRPWIRGELCDSYEPPKGEDVLYSAMTPSQ